MSTRWYGVRPDVLSILRRGAPAGSAVTVPGVGRTNLDSPANESSSQTANSCAGRPRRVGLKGGRTGTRFTGALRGRVFGGYANG